MNFIGDKIRIREQNVHVISAKLIIFIEKETNLDVLNLCSLQLKLFSGCFLDVLMLAVANTRSSYQERSFSRAIMESELTSIKVH